jgi:hypothetical protein
MMDEKTLGDKCTFSIGRTSCSADTFLVNQSLVFCINTSINRNGSNYHIRKVL